MLILAVLLGVIGVPCTLAAALVNLVNDEEIDNIRIDRILKLNLPEESFKEDFFQIEDKQGCAISANDVNEIIGKPLTAEDFALGEKIDAKDFAPAPGKDPISKSGHFEGDIKNPKFIEGRNAIRDNHMKWPKGEVPYVIANSYNHEERGIVARAIEEFHRRTCVRFRPRRNEYDYVFFTKKDGCFSMIGRDGGLQFLSLGDGCMYVGIVIHELMHAIGFWHEQSRADRDDFVTIFWDNIQQGQTHNFAKFTDGRLHHLGERYDYGSIMHYGLYEFSRFHDRPSIIPKNRNVYIGQRNGFSQTDVRKINKLYQCDAVLREDCVDSDSQCRGWAELGECKKNPKWMLVNCKRSCNQCRMKLSSENERETTNKTTTVL